MVSLNLLCISFGTKASLEEEVRGIDQVLSILGASGSYASVLKSLEKDGNFESPFLRQFQKLVIEKVQSKPGACADQETSDVTDRAQFSKEMTFHEIYRDSVFFEDIAHMLFFLKKKLNGEEDQTSAFLNRGYQEILIELENYLFKLQQAIIIEFVEQFGSSAEFEKRYKIKIEIVNGNYKKKSGSIADEMQFCETKLWQEISASNGIKVGKPKHYSHEAIARFEEVIEDIITASEFASCEFSSTLTGQYACQFFELLEPYRILRKRVQGSDQDHLEFHPLYDRYIEFSNSLVSKYRKAQHDYEKSYGKTAVFDPKEKRLRRRNSEFERCRQEFLEGIKAISSERIRNFKGLIQREQENQIRLKKQKDKMNRRMRKEEEEREKEKALAKVVKDAPVVEERFSKEKEKPEVSAQAVLEDVNEDIRSSEEIFEAPQMMKEEEKEGASAGSAAELPERENVEMSPAGAMAAEEVSPKAVVSEKSDAEDFEKWWEAFQVPHSKRKKIARAAAAAAADHSIAEEDADVELFECELSSKAFEFFSVMGGYAPWSPNLDIRDLNAFQSEIIRQYESYLKKGIYPGSVLPKSSPFSRPLFILPNLKRVLGSQDLHYRIFRLPHLPHGRSENTFYPALKDFYKQYFEEAGLSLENVKMK